GALACPLFPFHSVLVPLCAFFSKPELGDPLLNDDHALALGLASREELALIRKYSLNVNRLLREIWGACGITLVDFKVEFGRLEDGTIVLADEISPDTCRLWDSKTLERLDKDRFRRDLGGVEEAYVRVMERLTNNL
ncbi:phosphoribosylaminoimidazolesuccinocarboxamide synthase, partial [Oscillospiraceae bacterium 50-16]